MKAEIACCETAAAISRFVGRGIRDATALPKSTFDELKSSKSTAQGTIGLSVEKEIIWSLMASESKQEKVISNQTARQSASIVSVRHRGMLTRFKEHESKVQITRGRTKFGGNSICPLCNRLGRHCRAPAQW